MSDQNGTGAECQSLLFDDGHDDSEKGVDYRLRIKCSSPGIDPPPKEGRNGEINGKDWFTVWARNESSVKQFKDQVREAIGQTAKGRYLRLIAKGRLMAPDTAMLQDFKLDPEDYIHAVIAPVGVRGGQQAEMAQPGPSEEDGSSRLLAARRAFRSVGIGPNGVILSRREQREISRTNEGEADSSGESSGEENEQVAATPGTINDLEAGTSHSLRRRPRRGLDRLRSEYHLTRDEIAAIRLYFRRSIDRFAEMHRRRRQEGDESGNSRTDGVAPRSTQATASASTDEAPPSTDTLESASEGRRRLREERWEVEELWMDAQGPRSEFRMNLNTNNASAVGAQSLFLARGGRGAPRSIFEVDAPARFDTMAGVPGRAGAAGTSVASMTVGTDREFLWGFFMGFFMGFVMLFWMWMPSVSHKQKMGILTGIGFQLGFNILKHVSSDESGNTLDLDPSPNQPVMGGGGTVGGNRGFLP